MVGGGCDAVVIGAGLGGLACAARMARAGASVLVVEGNAEPGGLAGAFQRGDFAFEQSLHLMDAIGPGEPHRAVLDRLGIAEAVRFSRPASLRREIWPEHDIVVPHGIEPWLETMSRAFPSERTGLEGFVDTASRAHTLHAEHDETPTGLSRQTAGDVVDRFVSDRRLRAMLDLFASGWLGLPLDRLGAMQFLVAWYSFQMFTVGYPRGGSRAIVSALVEQIRAHGGEVLLGVPARRIVVEQHRARGVELEDGRWLPARSVISNASPAVTFDELVGSDCVDARYRARLRRLRPSISCVKVWLGFDGRRVDLRPRDYEVYLRPSYDSSWTTVDPERRGISVVFPANLGPGHAPAGCDVLSTTLLVPVSTWLELAKTRPGIQAEVVEALVTRVENALVPGLRSATLVREAATPETFQRFAVGRDGGIYGYHRAAGRTLGWRLPVETPLSGLWLVGASTGRGAGVTSVLRSGCDIADRVLRGLESGSRLRAVR